MACCCPAQSIMGRCARLRGHAMADAALPQPSGTAPRDAAVAAALARRTDRLRLTTTERAASLTNLLSAGDPSYGEADLRVISREISHEVIVEEIVTAVRGKLGVAAQ